MKLQVYNPETEKDLLPQQSDTPVTDRINFFLRLAQKERLDIKVLLIGEDSFEALMKEALYRPVIVSRIELHVCKNFIGVWPYIDTNYFNKITSMWIG